MSQSSKQKKWHGIPYNWKWRGWDYAFLNSYNKSPNAPLFPPKAWGAGWGFNFAYPMIKSKPLWKRALAFLLGALIVTLIIYVLVVIAMLIYFTFTPDDNILRMVKTADGYVLK